MLLNFNLPAWYCISNRIFGVLMKLIVMLAALLTLVGCSKDMSHNSYNNSVQNELTKKVEKGAHDGEAQFETQLTDSNLNFILPIGKMPDPSNNDYLSIKEYDSDEAGKKIVEVKGIHIILDRNSKLNIYNSSNLKAFKIEAKEITVSEEFKLPGAKLEIKAEILEFTREGKFNTSAVENSVIPEKTVDGKKGLTAGDIYLDVLSMEVGEKVRFVLNGGRGQAAGYGIPGKPGKSIESPNGANLRVCTTTITTCFEREIGSMELSRVQTCAGENFPSNGQDAIPAGAPGAGGDGGNLVLLNNLKINSNRIVQLSGDIGIVAPETLGGVGGSPRSFGTKFETKQVSDGLCSRTRIGGNTRLIVRPNQPVSGSTEDGKSAPSPIDAKEVSHEGKVMSSSDRNEFSEKYLGLRLLYAKDLYRNYKFAEAEAEFLSVFSLSQLLKNEEKLGQVEKESMLLLAQLRNHKDIEGYPLNFAPNLSMAKLVKLYKSEIDKSFKTLQFTSYFKNKINSVKMKSEKIKSQIEDLNQNIYLDKTLNSEAHNSHLTIEKSLNETIESQKAFDLAMQDVVAQIEAEARKNIHSQEKKKKLFGAIKLLASLAKASPAGQPAAAAIGTAIDTMVNVSQDEDVDWKDVVSSSYDSYEQLKDVDWKKSKSDWNKNYSDLYLDKFQERNPEIKKKQFEAYMRNLVNATKPLYKATSTYLEENYKNQVPRSAYEKEVEKIKQAHPRFKELTIKLSQLQDKKEKLNNDLIQTMSIIRETESNIVKSIQAISSTETDYVGFVGGLDFTIDDALSFYEKSAREKLLKYKSYVIKSYSYRLLKPWGGSLDLEKMDRNLSLFSISNGDTIDMDILKESYNEDLKMVSAEVFKSLSSGELKEYITAEEFDLNSGELSALKSGKSIVLDLSKKISKKESEENRRIISIELESADVLTKNEASVDFIFKHTGKSVLSKNDKNYSFVHESNNIHWISKIDGKNSLITPLAESSIEESLFALFLGDNTIGREDLKEYAGLESNVVLKLSEEASVVDLKSARIKVNYSFNLK